MIRVLHVVTKMDRAGLETMLMNYYRNINKQKVQFDFLTHRNVTGEYDAEILSLGGKIYSTYPIHPKYFFKYIQNLDLFFQDHKEYKIIHSHIDSLSTFVLHAAKKAKIPIRIAHSHNTSFDKDIKLPLRNISKKMLKNEATDYWACGQLAAKFMFGNNVLEEKNCKILKNAIDLEKFSYKQIIRNEYRNLLGIHNSFVVGHIGRFVEQKNHKFLLKIFYELYQKINNAVLLLIGDGPLLYSIKNLSHELGIEHAVKFLGVRSDVADLLQAMDCFLLPSLFEGLPVVLIEAQATGLPCIVSSSVSDEAKILDSTHFISLKRSSKEWVDFILQHNNIRNKNATSLLRVAGYDITIESKLLEKYYIELESKTM